jgi:hypothetical protein
MSVVRLVDAMTLRSIIERGQALSFECGTCRRLVAVDVLNLIGRLGADATIGECVESLCADAATSVVLVLL